MSLLVCQLIIGRRTIGHFNYLPETVELKFRFLNYSVKSPSKNSILLYSIF